MTPMSQSEKQLICPITLIFTDELPIGADVLQLGFSGRRGGVFEDAMGHPLTFESLKLLVAKPDVNVNYALEIKADELGTAKRAFELLKMFRVPDRQTIIYLKIR